MDMAWAVTTSKGLVKVPFVCQRCGNCCRHFLGNLVCLAFQEPNICTIYDERPDSCRDYPVYDGFGISKICPGFQLAQKQWKKFRNYTVQPWEFRCLREPSE